MSQSVREVRPLEKLGWVLRASDGNFGLTASGRDLAIGGVEIASEISTGWLTAPIDQTALLSEMLGELVQRRD